MRPTFVIIIILFCSNITAEETSEASSPLVEPLNQFVIWFDDLFADPDREYTETATSFWRLRQSFFKEESADLISRTSMRGRVNLPNLSSRLSLLFENSTDDLISDSSNELPEEDNDASVALEYATEDTSWVMKNNIGFKFGLNSLYVANRLSRKFIFGDHQLRLSNNLFWYEKEGFDNRFSILNDTRVNETNLFRNEIVLQRRQESYDEKGLAINVSSRYLIQATDTSAFQIALSADYNTKPLSEWTYAELSFGYRGSLDDTNFSYGATPFVGARTEEDWSPFLGIKLNIEYKFD